MAAVGRDGNNQISIIAYVVVEVETKDSWEWLLHILLEYLNQVIQRACAFIFDQQKLLYVFISKSICIYICLM